MIRKAVSVFFAASAGIVFSAVMIYLTAVYVDSIVKDNFLYLSAITLICVLAALLLFFFTTKVLYRRYSDSPAVSQADVFIVSALPFIPLVALLVIVLPHLLFDNLALVYHGGGSADMKGIWRDFRKILLIALPVMGISLMMFAAVFIGVFNKLLFKLKRTSSLLSVLFFVFCGAFSLSFASIGMNRLGQVALKSKESKKMELPANVSADLQYGWDVIKKVNQDSYEAYAYEFLKPDKLDIKLRGDSCAFSRLEFFIYLNSIDNYPRQVFARKKTELTSDCFVEVKLVDEVSGQEMLCSQLAADELQREYRINASIPVKDYSQCSTVRIEVSPPQGTVALLYRLLLYEEKEIPRRVLLLSLDSFALEHSNLLDGQDIDTNPMLRGLILHNENTIAFSGAKATANWTLPTHATMFSGLYPTQHRVLRFDRRESFNRDIKLLPELLKERGIEVFHLVSFLLISSRYGYYRGVDCYKIFQGNINKDLGHRGRRLVKDAVAALDESRDRDIFMFLHFYDAHIPYYNYPGNYQDLINNVEPCYYPKDTYKKVINDIFDGGFKVRNREGMKAKYSDSLQAYIPGIKVAYKLGLRDLDDILSEFFEELKALRLFDNTTIIITSDHGEEFFDHGTIHHQSLYNEILSIPFIIKFAKDSPYNRFLVNRERISPCAFEAHTTVFKNVLDLFSIDYPDYLSDAKTGGLSLEQLLTLSENQNTFAEYYFKRELDFNNYYEASLTDERLFKTIFSTYLHQDLSWLIEDEYLQLYDLNLDDKENNNLYPTAVDTGEGIFNRTIDRAVTARELIFEPEEGEELSKADISRLRALGYIK